MQISRQQVGPECGARATKPGAPMVACAAAGPEFAFARVVEIAGKSCNFHDDEFFRGIFGAQLVGRP
jgi:hypothetical protein